MRKVKYIAVEEAAQNWKISERSARNYCAQGRVEGALLEGKTWKIPSNAKKYGYNRFKKLAIDAEKRLDYKAA